MKIRRDQFKTLIKECLQELIAEGNISLAGASMVPQQQQNPHVRALAMQTKNPTMMEKIFADTANNSLPEHLSSDPTNINGNFQGMMPDMNNNFEMQQQGFVHVPQLNQQQFYPQQQQMMPQQQFANNNNNGASASPWARLAFNSPIRNRPGSDSGMSSVFGGGSANFLPGQNTGKFGWN